MSDFSVPNALVVGPPKIGEAISNYRKDWNFLPSVPDIGALRAGFSNGSITSDIQIIFIVDKFFDPQARDTSFEYMVAQLSPFCMLCVIAYNPDNVLAIQDRIEQLSFNNGVQPGNVYFIDTKKPARSIENAVTEFLNNPSVDAIPAAEIISGKSYELPENKENGEPIAPVQIKNAPIVKGETLGQVIAVTSSKGGSGKSTVSVLLAAYLAKASINSVKEKLEKKPLKVVMVDLDVRDGQLGFFTGSYTPTVLKLRQLGISKETILDTVIHNDGLGVDVLLAPRRPRAADELLPEFYVDLINHLRTMYDYVILDTSVNYLDPLLEKVAYPISDLIVAVTNVVTTTVFSIARWIFEVTSPVERNGMNINKRKIGLVINKSLKGVNMTDKTIMENAQGVPIITAIPSNEKLITHATNIFSMGKVLEHPDFRRAYRRLAESIVGDKYKLSANV